MNVIKQGSLTFINDLTLLYSTSGVNAFVWYVSAVKDSVDIPVLVGSGVNEENVTDYMHCNGLIIGSHLKMHGHWANDLDHIRVNHFMTKVERYRQRMAEQAAAAAAEEDEFKPMHAQGE